MSEKIHGLKILKDTQVSGVVVEQGNELLVPKDISEDQARSLLRMKNRAEEIEVGDAKNEARSKAEEKTNADAKAKTEPEKEVKKKADKGSSAN